MYHIHVLLISMSPKFQIFLNSRFRDTGNFWEVHRMTQNDLEHYKVKDILYMSLMSQSPELHPMFLYDQPFSKQSCR